MKMGLLTSMIIVLALVPDLSRSDQTITNGAYVWQRMWTPILASALTKSAPLVGEWRVLVAETDDAGRLAPVSVNWDSIPTAGHSVVAVMRIDGRLDHLDQEHLLTDIAAQTKALLGQGAAIRAVEIDYDSATSQLARYAGFLKLLKSRFATPVQLSITVLPDWIASPSFGLLLEQANEFVLQLHAVRNPKSALFDAELASGWVEEFAGKTTKPFRVSLPTYGSRVVKDKAGTVIAVESEAQSLVVGASAREVIADPVSISAFVTTLHRHAPKNLLGIVWFRLPTAEDHRAWSFATWEAVMTGQIDKALVTSELRPSSTPGMQTVMLANHGDTDSSLPRRLILPEDCNEADGANGYELQHDQARLVLHRVDEGLLHPGHQRLIGWARCTSNQVIVDVEP